MAVIGNNGTVDGAYNTGDFIWGTQLLTAPSAMTLTSAHVWQEGSTSGRVIIRLYNSSGNTIATSDEIASTNAGGAYDSASISGSISNGTQFRISLISNGVASIGTIAAGGTGNKQAKSAGGIVYPTFDSDPITFDFSEDGNIAVYITYDAGGGSGNAIAWIRA